MNLLDPTWASPSPVTNRQKVGPVTYGVKDEPLCISKATNLVRRTCREVQRQSLGQDS